jgi:hypothetical protein
LRTFGVIRVNVRNAGQTGLMQLWLLLTQHLLALAAGDAPRCKAYLQSGHSNALGKTTKS